MQSADRRFLLPRRAQPPARLDRLPASIACLFVWSTPGNRAALARASAWLNILNLIPVWRLDGGQAVGLMNQGERLILLAGTLGVWLILRQNLRFLVAAGQPIGSLPGDFSSRPSRATTVYCLVALLGSVLGSGLQ
ncbi:MAG TPA: hypothetical protein VEI01_03290 [Terriglobales bacterium]|nr:hypothetical protein [Terriglobales bacterium]